MKLSNAEFTAFVGLDWADAKHSLRDTRLAGTFFMPVIINKVDSTLVIN